MLCEMAGRKRKLDEWDVSEMEESEGATVHGVFTFETFELQRPMYVRCKPHVPLLNLNRTHAPSEGDGRTIHDNIYINIYIYIQTAQVLIGLERAR